MKHTPRPASAALPPLLAMLWITIVGASPAGAGTAAAAGARADADHDAASGVAAHESIRCARCHAERAGSLASFAATACTSCHAEASTAGDRALDAFHAPGRSCADCHSFHDPTVVRAKGASFHVTRIEECAACHVRGKDPSRISEGHRAAAAYYHSDHEDSVFESASDVCLACHSSSPDRSVFTEVSFNATPPRFHTEATHPYGVEVPLGSNAGIIRMRDPLDPRIRLIDGKIECLTCHDLTETAKDALVRFDSKYDLCLGCHDMGNRKRSTQLFAQRPIDP